MWFLRTESYEMFYETSMNGALFKTLGLLSRRGRARNFNIELTLLLQKCKTNRNTKYNDTMDLLHYMPPVRHNYFKSLPHTQIGKE